MSWRNRPKFINELDHDIDYLVFIDESGDTSYKNILKSGVNVPQNDQFFIISACIFNMKSYRELGTRITKLKNKHWNDGKYTDSKGTKRVCFRGSEINSRTNAFSENVIDYPEFMKDLYDFMNNLDMTLFSVCINKTKVCEKYSYQQDPYQISLKFLFERLCKYFIKPSEKAIVILEQRGKKEDKKLHSKIMEQINSGTEYTDPSQYKLIDGVYFNPKHCLKDKSQTTFYGLEIADLCCYAIYKYQLMPQYDAFDIISKYFYGGKYPFCHGKGFKRFP